MLLSIKKATLGIRNKRVTAKVVFYCDIDTIFGMAMELRSTYFLLIIIVSFFFFLTHCTRKHHKY